MPETGRSQAEKFADALLAAVLFAADPVGLGGICVRARPGPVRDAWLDTLRDLVGAEMPVRRLPAGAPLEALTGGIDLAGSLRLGKPVHERGLIAACRGGVLIVPMAERLEPAVAAAIARALDDPVAGQGSTPDDGCHSAGLSVVLIDESDSGQTGPPRNLLDRTALQIDLDGIAIGEIAAACVAVNADIAAIRACLAEVACDGEATTALCAAACALGIASLRPPMLAARVAKCHAALHGRSAVNADDLAAAGRLVLALRAVCMPASQSPSDAPPDQTKAEGDDPAPSGASAPQDAVDDRDGGPGQENAENTGPDPSSAAALEDVVLRAVLPSLPSNLLAFSGAGRSKMGGRGKTGARGSSGSMHDSSHGRPAGSRRGELRARQRISIPDTLRAAAPWQAIRRAQTGSGRGLVIVGDDIRIRRYKARALTTNIFLVDASGSAASQRLAEAKGAVELILGECYVRRDKVALIAFRGTAAELLLPPTRSLSRAKRSLADLPGGGGTPLACGLEAAILLAGNLRRQGEAPQMVVLTDGRANIARDLKPGRARAMDDASAAARRIREVQLPCVLIDISARGSPEALAIATCMGARYLLIPGAEAATVANAVGRMRGEPAPRPNG